MGSLVGTLVKFDGEFGAVRKGEAATASKFAASVKAGQMGKVTARHPSPNLPGWWLVEVEIDGAKYDAPLTEYQIEVMSKRATPEAK